MALWIYKHAKRGKHHQTLYPNYSIVGNGVTIAALSSSFFRLNVWVYSNLYYLKVLLFLNFKNISGEGGDNI